MQTFMEMLEKATAERVTLLDELALLEVDPHHRVVAA